MKAPLRNYTTSLRGLLDGKSLYVGGIWATASAATMPVLDPATEETIGQLALGAATDVDRAARRARAAFPAWSATPPSERAAVLGRIHALVLARAEELAQAISLEMGAQIAFARAVQVPLAAEHLRVARDLLRDYAFTTVQDGMAILREPIGVCGLITPWNWPLYQIAAKVGPALAAGCTMVLKPSEMSPLSALLFTQIVHDFGRAAGRVQSGERHRSRRGYGAGFPPRDRHGLDHRFQPRRHPGCASRSAHGEAGDAGARRKVPQHPVARCGYRGCRTARGHGCVPQRRTVVQRADTHDRAAADARRGGGLGRGDGRYLHGGPPPARRQPCSGRSPIERSSNACRRW